jgi:hypothetical protein
LPSCWKRSRARPAPVATASSSFSSTMPVGTARKTCPSPTASGSSISRPAVLSFSPPSTFGRSSTNRSPTSTSPQSTISMPPLPRDAVISCKRATPSQSTPNSIGGQNPSIRTNQPEMVLLNRAPFHAPNLWALGLGQNDGAAPAARHGIAPGAISNQMAYAEDWACMA